MPKNKVHLQNLLLKLIQVSEVKARKADRNPSFYAIAWMRPEVPQEESKATSKSLMSQNSPGGRHFGSL